MLRTFRPALETLENREVFAADPLAGGLMPGLAAPHSGAQENLAAMVGSNRTETVNNNETINIHANRAATLTAAPVFRSVHDAAAHDALFTDLGNAGNDPAQIIAILIGMAKSSTNDAVANSMGSNLDALPVAGSRASDAQFSFQGAATDGASNQSSLLANQEYYNLNPTTSRPKALQSSSSQSQIIAVLIGL